MNIRCLETNNEISTLYNYGTSFFMIQENQLYIRCNNVWQPIEMDVNCQLFFVDTILLQLQGDKILTLSNEILADNVSTLVYKQDCILILINQQLFRPLLQISADYAIKLQLVPQQQEYPAPQQLSSPDHLQDAISQLMQPYLESELAFQTPHDQFIQIMQQIGPRAFFALPTSVQIVINQIALSQVTNILLARELFKQHFLSLSQLVSTQFIIFQFVSELDFNLILEIYKQSVSNEIVQFCLDNRDLDHVLLIMELNQKMMLQFEVNEAILYSDYCRQKLITKEQFQTLYKLSKNYHPRENQSLFDAMNTQLFLLAITVLGAEYTEQIFQEQMLYIGPYLDIEAEDYVTQLQYLIIIQKNEFIDQFDKYTDKLSNNGYNCYHFAVLCNNSCAINKFDSQSQVRARNGDSSLMLYCKQPHDFDDEILSKLLETQVGLVSESEVCALHNLLNLQDQNMNPFFVQQLVEKEIDLVVFDSMRFKSFLSLNLFQFLPKIKYIDQFTIHTYLFKFLDAQQLKQALKFIPVQQNVNVIFKDKHISNLDFEKTQILFSYFSTALLKLQPLFLKILAQNESQLSKFSHSLKSGQNFIRGVSSYEFARNFFYFSNWSDNSKVQMKDYFGKPINCQQQMIIGTDVFGRNVGEMRDLLGESMTKWIQ
ncbi:Hypothetical_protein [Hexamita inflata]|uniref:Hypothetical_protein n=1 Tax=Hexamita inflata TaxID=28002 RepID=A0AA86P180_9EUKA|nr:Hypothetical protein HINF_LOCUS16194 [Hexamita inflata]